MSRPLAILIVLVLGAAALGGCRGPQAPEVGRAGAPASPQARATAASSPTPTSAAGATVATAITPTLAPTIQPSPALAFTPTATPIPSPPATPSAGQTEPVPIVMYHYVRPDPGPGDPAGEDLSVTPEDFAAEMDYLAAQHYTTMTLGELEVVRERRAPLPARPVVLTFDDGYRDFYTDAWPVLRRHHFKATIFVITGVVGSERYLSWDMIRELDGSGLIEVGSHTVDHPELPALSDAQARAEIVDSKKTLEEHLGHPVVAFSYPAGHYTQREVDDVRQAGYGCAVTTRGAFARAGDPALELPRFRIHGTRGLPQLQANL
ncbi:MAG TPA: polysaccharide deacetylase family protein [Thermomicrobiaceae bacterium]|nr:polysaccharide deacetylase family protein [Thermomicrobiaceae bacterium]